MALIQLDDVGLLFHVRRFGRISLKEYLLQGFFRRSKKTTFEVQALEHINLTVDEGDRLGIIGHNGAGKSTLLKLLAGIYPPTAAAAASTGRSARCSTSPWASSTDATGWENIMYRGYLQGETPRSIRAKMQPIAEFSELGDFLNMPVRYYSAGMMVRLAFSIATAIEPEILIVDEVLVGRRPGLSGQGPRADADADVHRPGGDRRQPRSGLAGAAVRPRAVARPRQDSDDRPDRGSHRGVYPTSQRRRQRRQRQAA